MEWKPATKRSRTIACGVAWRTTAVGIATKGTITTTKSSVQYSVELANTRLATSPVHDLEET